jgi:hypothetical protein
MENEEKKLSEFFFILKTATILIHKMKKFPSSSRYANGFESQIMTITSFG